MKAIDLLFKKLSTEPLNHSIATAVRLVDLRLKSIFGNALAVKLGTVIPVNASRNCNEIL